MKRPRFSSWLSLTHKRRVHVFIAEMSEMYHRPNHVTYHAFEILDKIIDACDEPESGEHRHRFLTLTSLACFIMACKMDGKYPPYEDVVKAYDVTHEDLKEYELWILTTIDWKISSCYSFMDVHMQIPTNMLPLYNKLVGESYKYDQLNNYSTDVIKESFLSLLSDGHPCFLSDIRKNVDIQERHLCEQGLQSCMDTICLSSQSPVSVCGDKHVVHFKRVYGY